MWQVGTLKFNKSNNNYISYKTSRKSLKLLFPYQNFPFVAFIYLFRGLFFILFPSVLLLSLIITGIKTKQKTKKPVIVFYFNNLMPSSHNSLTFNDTIVQNKEKLCPLHPLQQRENKHEENFKVEK